MATAIELQALNRASLSSREYEFSGFSPDQLYQALPLTQPTESIRILDLETSGDPESPLTGILRVVSLKDRPRFHALSYVWGTEYTSSIFCNDCRLPITRNCRDALLALRRRNKGATFTIWVDAVCINQTDYEERSHQVALMQEVFTWAETVFIWLEPKGEACDHAIESIRMVSKMRPPRMLTPWVKKGRVMNLHIDKLAYLASLASYFIPRTFAVTWFMILRRRRKQLCTKDELDELMNQDWLHRAWTFQEVILGSNPVIICGDKSISWSDLQRAFDYYYDRKFLTHPFYFRVDVNSETMSAWFFLIFIWETIERPTEWHGVNFRQLPDGGKSISIEDYTSRYLSFYHQPGVGLWIVAILVALLYLGPVVISASVLSIHKRSSLNILLLLIPAPLLVLLPLSLRFFLRWRRVTIFEGVILAGVLQALRERAASEPKDKSFAIHGVLRALGAQCTEADYSKSLGQVYRDLFVDLLQWNGRLLNLLLDVGATLEDAPSWVPDWNSLQERAFVETRYVQGPIHGNQEPRKLLVSREELVVEGAILDMATYCSGSFDRIEVADFDTSSQDRRNVLIKTLGQISSWLADGRHNAQVSSTYESLPKSTLDALHARVKDYETDQTHFYRWLRALTNGASYAKPLSEQVILDRIAADPDLRAYTVDVCNTLHKKRSLFVTRDGNIGSGPPHMRVDDNVARVSGVSMPMILRESEEKPGKYFVIGPAFVCGMVDWLESDGEGLDWETLTLI